MARPGRARGRRAARPRRAAPAFQRVHRSLSHRPADVHRLPFRRPAAGTFAGAHFTRQHPRLRLPCVPGRRGGRRDAAQRAAPAGCARRGAGAGGGPGPAGAAVAPRLSHADLFRAGGIGAGGVSRSAGDPRPHAARWHAAAAAGDRPGGGAGPNDARPGRAASAGRHHHLRAAAVGRLRQGRAWLAMRARRGGRPWSRRSGATCRPICTRPG